MVVVCSLLRDGIGNVNSSISARVQKFRVRYSQKNSPGEFEGQWRPDSSGLSVKLIIYCIVSSLVKMLQGIYDLHLTCQFH